MLRQEMEREFGDDYAEIGKDFIDACHIRKKEFIGEQDLNRYQILSARILRKLIHAYTVYASYDFFSEAGTGDMNPINSCREMQRIGDSADSFIYGDNIFLKCAVLPPKNAFKMVKRNGINEEIPYSFFERTVGIMMEDMLYKDTETYLNLRAKLEQKCLLFLYNFAPGDNLRICDAANHYTDKIQNRILFHFPGGDGGVKCRTAYENTSSDLIPTGTYITLSPYYPGNPEVCEIIRLWQEHFESKKIRGNQILSEK